MPYESSLVRLHKKAVHRNGPCPDIRSGPWATCPLLIQQAVAAAADQQMILAVCYHELREMTKGESTLFYKPMTIPATSYPLSLFHIIIHKSLTYNPIPILSDRKVALNRGSTLSEDGPRNENQNRDGSDRQNFEPHQTGENEMIQIGRS